MARPLDSYSQLALVFGTVTGNPTGKNLAPLGYVLPEFVGVFVFDGLDLVYAVRAHPFPGAPPTLAFHVTPPV
jgi:hypothetical protein